MNLPETRYDELRELIRQIIARTIHSKDIAGIKFPNHPIDPNETKETIIELIQRFHQAARDNAIAEKLKIITPQQSRAEKTIIRLALNYLKKRLATYRKEEPPCKS